MKKLLPLLSVGGLVAVALLLRIQIGPRPASELPIPAKDERAVLAAPAPHVSERPPPAPSQAVPPRPRQEQLVAPEPEEAGAASTNPTEAVPPALDPRLLLSPQVPERTLDPEEARKMRWKLRQQDADTTPTAPPETAGSNPEVSLDRKSTSLPTVPDRGKHDRTDVEVRVPLGDSWAVRNRVRVDSLESDDPERGQTDVDATTGVELRF